MSTKVSYTEAKANLAQLMDKAIDDGETVIITRRGRPDVALVSAQELGGLLTTIHLLKSPANAERLLAAIERARRGEGTVMTLEEVMQMVGMTEEELREYHFDEEV